MKKFHRLFLYALIALCAGSLLYAQNDPTDKATVPLTDPGKPAFVKATLQNGGITVRGYSGQEVIVEATLRTKAVTEDKTEDKAQGLKRILVNSTGLSISERDNRVSINADSYRQTVDLVIQVPNNTSLQLNAYRNGDIIVENVKGELDITNYSGPIRLTGISGAAVANTYRGGVTATFNEVTPDSHMSFSTYSGDIDVTFPASTKANLKMKSDRGDVFSDFEFQIVKNPKEGFDFRKESSAKGALASSISREAARIARDAVEKISKSTTNFKVSFGGYIYAKVNGGGPVYQFKNYRGDILIRKGK